MSSIVSASVGLESGEFMTQQVIPPVVTEEGEFNRIEDKHVVEISQLEKVLAVLNEKMKPSYLDNGTVYTLIESLYFDSSNLDFFKHHFSGMESRHKLRSRRYAPNGVWNNAPALLELKTKKNGVCLKTRFKVPAPDFENLISAEAITLSQELMKLNNKVEMAALIRRVEQVNELTQRYHLRPNVSVTYHRYAFEDGEFRVTIDTNIQVKILKSMSAADAYEIMNSEVWPKAEKVIKRYNGVGKFVLETKHQGTIPEWFNQLVEESGIKKSSFSKYCWGIAKEVESKANILQ